MTLSRVIVIFVLFCTYRLKFWFDWSWEPVEGLITPQNCPPSPSLPTKWLQSLNLKYSYIVPCYSFDLKWQEAGKEFLCNMQWISYNLVYSPCRLLLKRHIWYFHLIQKHTCQTTVINIIEAWIFFINCM